MVCFISSLRNCVLYPGETPGYPYLHISGVKHHATAKHDSPHPHPLPAGPLENQESEEGSWLQSNPREGASVTILLLRKTP